MTKELYDKRYYLKCKRFQLRKSRAELAIQEIMKFSPEKVLDVGCGLGTLVKSLRDQGVEAYGVDFAQTLKDDFKLNEDYFVITDAKKLPFRDKFFDVVISTDFFEHLPEEEIEIVLKEMNRVGRVILAKVAYESKLTNRQHKLHLTNKPKEFWEQKLKGVILI